MKRQQFIHWCSGVAVAALLSGAAAIGTVVASASPAVQVAKAPVAASRSTIAKQRARMAAKRPPPKNLAASPASRAAPAAAAAPSAAIMPGAAAAMRPASDNPYLAYRQAQPEAPPVTAAPAPPPLWPSQPVSAPPVVLPPPVWASPPASPAPVSAAPVTPPAVAYVPSGSPAARDTGNPYLPAAPAAVDRGVADSPEARPASGSPSLFSGVYLGGLQLVSPVRPPLDQAILPTFKKVYPTGDKPLIVVTFKCPTELVGVTPLPTKALHGLVDLGMGALNSSNLLPFNMQQVCQ